MSNEAQSTQSAGVAVIGMAGRFPGAPDVEALWSLLRDGREGIPRFSREALLEAGLPRDLIDNPAYVPAGGLIEGVDRFDAGRFGYSPREAALMDPQQRVFLECSLSALENAGHDPRSFEGWIGVFAGSGAPSYLLHHATRAKDARTELRQLVMGSLPDFLATRVAYRLDLRGPALDIQTACSTSLVATHLACQNLLGFQCDMAIAGGVTLSLAQGYLYEPDSILSPDGHCRPFDARAQGTVPGSGCGVVVLRRLEDALEDGDDILAVIRGSAVNNDGAAKVGFTAPSVEGQEQAISLALGMAGFSAESISYLETHGTGTRLGDPIEIRALARVFGEADQKRCAIGSIKSNLGHLDTAAGVTGLIKTILMLRHRTLVPTLHFEAPNPELGLHETPFHVNTKLRPWRRLDEDTPLRAGVSSFGIGGTNAHVVLEEAPAQPARRSRGKRVILPLSAKSPAALDAMSAALAAHLDKHPDLPLEDAAFTLQRGRQALELRRAVVAASVDEARQSLRDASAAGPPVEGAKKVAFLFPGQGAQHPGMGKGLYRELPVFREALDACATLLGKLHGIDLLSLLFGPEARAEQLEETAIAQPALFTVEYALARQWMEWGVLPDVLLGHSVGEYAAACLAQVFSLEEALDLVVARGRLIQAMPRGAMLSVSLPEEEIAPRLGPSLSIAAVNAPDMVTVAGPTQAIAELEERLRAEDMGITCRRLRTSHAFHSAMMDPVLEPFRARVAALRPKAPTIPILSCATGALLSAEEAQSPAYWARQIRQPVRFYEGVRRLFEAPRRALLEVGPGKTLGALAARKAPAGVVVRSSMPAPQAGADELSTLLTTAADLWSAGAPLDFARMHDEPRRRVALPGYAFARERHWLDAKAPVEHATLGPQQEEEGWRKRPDIGEWFYELRWEPIAARESGLEAGSWLLLADRSGLGDAMAQALRAQGVKVQIVRAGEQLKLDGEVLSLRPGCAEDYSALFAHLASQGFWPDVLVHLFTFDSATENPSERSSLDGLRSLGFDSLMALGRALAGIDEQPSLRIGVVSSEVCAVLEGDPLSPAKALVRGPAQVLPLELSSISLTHIDATFGVDAHRVISLLADQSAEALLAIRKGIVHRPRLSRIPVAAAPSSPRRIKRDGVYVITGGLGGMGRTFVERLVATGPVRLALLARSTPSPEQRAWMAGLEARGAKILSLTVDVGDGPKVTEAFTRIREALGEIDGVIHAAGLPGSGLIASGTPAQCEDVLRPKVEGTLNLVEALGPGSKAWLVLCASLAGVGFATGMADYAAANAFLDAYAQRAAGGPIEVVSIDWDGWAEVGMGARRLDEPMKTSSHVWADTAMKPAEGAEVLARLLDREAVGSQWVVLTKDPSALASLASLASERRARRAPRALSARPSLGVAFVAPRSEIERSMAAIWESELGCGPIGVDDDFFRLGGESLVAIRILTRIRKRLRVDVPLARFIDNPTIGQLARTIAAERGARAPEPGPTPPPVSERLIRFEAGPPGKTPLFFLHPVGGMVFQYAHLARQLGDDRPVFGIRALPSDLDAEEPLSIEHLAQRYVAIVEAIQPTGPCLLLGSSMGGMLAFAMAQELHRRGRGLSEVFMLDTPEPAAMSIVEDMRSDAAIDRYIDTLFPHLFRGGASLDELPPDLKPAEFYAMFRRLGRDGSSYVPKPYPGRITYFRAEERDPYNPARPEASWIDLARGGIEIHVVPGNHMTMMAMPHVEVVAGHVRRIINARERA
uniref:Short-chain dehydrogenase/reductase SDR n=1 Tax=Racemicystis crocea TaxID=1707966 RepID=A0A3S7V0M1_9BACT|nr:short-chain dehydrogenase/reductase SDR [Racemicystis crocea]